MAVATGSRNAPEIVADRSGADDLFERLRLLRNEMAEKRRIRPFQILNNRTLQELAAQAPLTVAEARAVHGVGKKNERTIVPKFIDEIRRWRDENRIT